MKSEDWFAIFFWGCIFFLGIRYEYIKYLERKKKEKAQIKLKDVKNMSKEECDSLLFSDRSNLIRKATKNYSEAPRGTEEQKKAKEELIEVSNALLGANIKPGDFD